MAEKHPKTRDELAQYLDHTILKPEANQTDVERVTREAIEYRCKSVCVEMKWLKVVSSLLEGTTVIPITVISFPHGNDATENKIRQTVEAIKLGAQEIDMVLNRDLLKGYDYAAVYHDIQSVVRTAGMTPVKVILETSELTQEQKIAACTLAKAAGAKFVKTSTGFSKSGATREDVALMRRVVGPEMGVKASGGVRTYEDAIAMIECGATRIGTSNSVAILEKVAGTGAY